MNRRHFLATAALGSAGLAAGCVSAGPRRISPNGRLNHACIGVGGMMGRNDLQNFLSHPRTQVVALCDVDRRHLESAAALVPGVRVYTDWREMLAREGDRMDSVNVTVPDHMHAPIALEAMRRGKHVYVQKPLCHDVAECRALMRAAARARVVTQLGTQYASGTGDRLAVQLLREGVVGRVQRVIVCSNRPGAEQYRLKGPRPAQGVPPPDHLAWNLWLGTAPARDFAPDMYHPVQWRSWQDFGTGWLGDIGCHIFDAVWKGLGLTAPLTVTAAVQDSWRLAPDRRADTWPQSEHVTWVFPGNAMSGGREIPVDWFDGDHFPPADAQMLVREAGFNRFPGEASLVIGDEGALLLPHGSGPVLLPVAKFKERARPKIAGRNHYHHFLDACLGGEPTESGFAQTGPMAEAILLGTVAIRTPGVTLHWDAAHGRVSGDAAAGRWLRRTYRAGW